MLHAHGVLDTVVTILDLHQRESEIDMCIVVTYDQMMETQSSLRVGRWWSSPRMKRTKVNHLSACCLTSSCGFVLVDDDANEEDIFLHVTDQVLKSLKAHVKNPSVQRYGTKALENLALRSG